VFFKQVYGAFSLKLCSDVDGREAGPESVFQDVTCRVRGAPLAGREGKFVLKYFLLRKVTRIQGDRRKRIVARK
jgi:hypothetical protein